VNVEVTWKDVAAVYPEQVQLYVQKYGPLPDGPITEEDYIEFKRKLESNE